jgi:hypothetical protein
MSEEFMFYSVLNKLDNTSQFLKKIITLLFIVFIKLLFWPYQQTQYIFLFPK